MHTPALIRIFYTGVMLLCTLLVSACASLLVPEAYDVSLLEMQSKVATQFPLKKDFLNQSASLELSRPALALIPQQERIAAEFTYRARALGQRPLEGSLRIRSGLYYDASSQSLRLRDVALDSITSSLNAPRWIQNGLQLAAEQLLKTSLENYTVYQVKPAQLSTMQSLGLRIGQPQIEAQGIRIPLLKN